MTDVQNALNIAESITRKVKEKSGSYEKYFPTFNTDEIGRDILPAVEQLNADVQTMAKSLEIPNTKNLNDFLTKRIEAVFDLQAQLIEKEKARAEELIKLAKKEQQQKPDLSGNDFKRLELKIKTLSDNELESKISAYQDPHTHYKSDEILLLKNEIASRKANNETFPILEKVFRDTVESKNGMEDYLYFTEAGVAARETMAKADQTIGAVYHYTEDGKGRAPVNLLDLIDLSAFNSRSKK